MLYVALADILSRIRATSSSTGAVVTCCCWFAIAFRIGPASLPAFNVDCDAPIWDVDWLICAPLSIIFGKGATLITLTTMISASRRWISAVGLKIIF